MIRFLLALWLGKFIFFLTRYFKIGGGSAAPGYYSLKVCPDLVQRLTPKIPAHIIITGTNGKTTTAKLLSHLVESQNVNVLRNATGSNMERGIASSLISKSNFFGQINNIEIGIWETDEAAFNSVVFKIKPQIIVFLNAFRDQLDRYGEVDTVVKKWLYSLNRIAWDTTILINAGDKNTAFLATATKDNSKIKSLSFKVKNHELFNEVSFIQQYKALSDPEFEAEVIKNEGLSGTHFKLSYPKGKIDIKFSIPGIYHIYDFLAAFGVYYLLNLPTDKVEEDLKDFSPAFGRVEKISFGEHTGYIFLIKNPAGATQVFETIVPNKSQEDTLMVALNDNFADGTDVSWIWDAQFEKLNPGSYHMVIASGARAQDLALRLKYAGFSASGIYVENDLERALQMAKSTCKGKVFILPTYTALLQLQEIMAKTGIKEYYWKGSK